MLTDFDLHLLGEGTHYRNYERLGAHLREHEGFRGVHFAVWAPNAHAGQRGRQLQPLGRPPAPDAAAGAARASGSCSSPTCRQGEVYKFEIKSRHNGYLVQKSDPYGFAAELRPKTASVVWDVTSSPGATTSGWPTRRPAGSARPADRRSTRCTSARGSGTAEQGDRFLNYRELADELVAHLEAHRTSRTSS